MYPLASFKTFWFKGLKVDFLRISQVLLTMYSRKRKTQKYSFKNPNIDDLMSLIPEIESSIDFRIKYGSIISLMKLGMKEGILSNLVQFYDPMCRCFTFPNY